MIRQVVFIQLLALLGTLQYVGAASSDQVPLGLGKTSSQHIQRPNIVFILVDDQDLQLDSLSYMPLVNKHLREKGTVYKNHFVTTALCCPSRVSLWTGKQAHNTNVTDVNPPYGGYPKFVSQGHNDNFLPVWLQSAGYDTYYTGKLFNAHTVDNYDKPFVNGFNGSDFLLDPYTYQYLNSAYQRNHDPPVSYKGRHTTDVISEKALGFLDDALSGDRPFFLAIAPVAPHSNVGVPDNSSFEDLGKLFMSSPIPLERHKHLFENVTVPRTENFNPDSPSGVNWISKLPKQDQSNIDYNDYFYRERLRALQGVDELVEAVVNRLEEADVLDNTYVIYTSDNGYHIGQHRLQPGKECGFEEDIRVPLFVRGPQVPENGVVDSVTTHIDLIPTIFEIASLPLKDEFDGTPIPLTEETILVDSSLRHEHVNVEYWGMAIEEGEAGLDENGKSHIYLNNTYKALRVIGEDYNLYYSVWCTNEHQLYDLSTDPYELRNLYPSGKTAYDSDSQLLGYPTSSVIARLDALLLVLKSCKGIDCIKPWNVLHPQGDVQSLKDSLNTRYDTFYMEQVKVEYNWCEFGYIIDAEGPQIPLTYRSGLSWSEWA